MINYLAQGEIDKAKWDLCIEQSANSMIYAYSWYLDIVSPGWEALVRGDYEAIFPLTHRKKIVPYLYQPFFTQQLGLFQKEMPTPEEVDVFLKAIPVKYRFADIQLNENSEPPSDGWNFRKRKNFILGLKQPYAKLFKNFNGPTKRNIKKANGNLLTINSLESDIAVDFYIRHKGTVTNVLQKSDYDRLKKLFREAGTRGMMNSMGVYDKKNDLITMAVLLTDKNRIYLIHNCASEKGRKLLGMYFLVDSIIALNAGQEKLLDFEGSDISGIGQFNKGFGAHKKNYFRLRINRLPWFVKWMKN